jgi:hypothetical protein
MNMPRPKYEMFLILKFFINPHDLMTKTLSSRGSEEPFRKNYIFVKFFLLAEIFFAIFFLHNKFISESIS